MPTGSGSFSPVHQAHAIEQVVLAVHFARPVDDRALANIRNVSTAFKNDLPGGGDIQGIPLPFGINIPGGLPIGIPGGMVTGKVLNRTRPDGTIETELKLEQNGILFRTSDYTRWQDVWARANRYFDGIVDAYNVPLSGVTLHFIDKFIWNGDPTQCTIDELLRSDSRYVAPHIFQVHDLWHCHTGAFLRPDEHTKRLLNLNIDSKDESKPDGQIVRSVSIGTVLTDQFGLPGLEPLELNSLPVRTFIGNRFGMLHALSKAIFREVITNEMALRIALTD